MADNALVTPLVWSSERGIRERTQDKEQMAPKLIPVTVTKVVGETVTVKANMKGVFTIPELTIPQSFSAWIRQPTQVGDRGFAISTDFYLGGQSGLGGGTANFRGRANLTNLVFIPVSQVKFPTNTTRNLNAAFISGPEGAVIQDQAGNTVLTINGTKLTYADNKGNKVIIDTSTNKMALVLGHGCSLYLGGDGLTGVYGQVKTSAGDCTNVFARVDAP